jgi:C4-dicarboxylate transporter DctM subunit
MIVAVLIGLFFLLIVIGAPIAVALGAATVVTAALYSPIPPAIIGQKIFSNLDHFTLMAVPFFFFTAALMESGGLVNRLVGLANALVRHWRGGLGVTSVLTCVFFAAISGSSPATVAAVGRIMFPALVRAGYSQHYAIGALATAGSIGILIPPSIPLILYGFITETSITRLFIAGIVPGLLYGFGMMLMARWLAGRQGYEVSPRATWAERRGSFRRAIPALMLPTFIVVGIYGYPEFEALGHHFAGGAIFTPTEAAIISMLLALGIGLFVYREHDLRSVMHVIVETAPRVGLIFWVAVNAILFHRDVACRKHAALAVPCDGEPGAHRGRFLPRGGAGHPAVYPATVPRRSGDGHRPGSLRHHRGREHRARPHHPAGGTEPVRR